MSYRPKNWEDTRFYACMDLTEGGGTYRDIYEVFDTGADKMFEELSKLPIEELMKIFAKHTDRYEELK